MNFKGKYAVDRRTNEHTPLPMDEVVRREHGIGRIYELNVLEVDNYNMVEACGYASGLGKMLKMRLLRRA